MLQAENIHKTYGDLRVLKGVNIQVNAGEIVSIVGSSGAGKSTLLHILGTLDNADDGKIFLNNQPVYELRGKKLAAFRNQHIGFIFQFHHLLPEFTALENVCIPGWIAKRKNSEVKESAEKLLNLLGLGNRMENKPNQLSGGEQQRVAFARILLVKPDVLFLDEATSALDEQSEALLYRLLRQELPQTIMVSVGHRSTLNPFHEKKLLWQENGQWQFA